MDRPSFAAAKRSELPFWILAAFLWVLWIAGGSARADAIGQAVVRLAAWTFLAVVILAGIPVAWRKVRSVGILVGLAILLVVIQLIPLPPAIWTALPSRELLLAAADLTGQPQLWRPLSISPGATANALSSLIVPVVTLVLAASLTGDHHQRIAALLLGLVFGGCLVGLLQFSGARFDNPLINEIKGFVAGNFANRNHLALFVAIGIVLTSVWGFGAVPRKRWRPLLALALLPFFVLIILATGSRSGLILGLVAMVCSLLIGRHGALRELQRLTRRTTIGLFAGFAGAIAAAVFLAVRFGRAEAIERLSLEATEDLRLQALPVVADMAGRYFPAGSGFGTFDPAYRIAEPDLLLRPLYFNHAHNDWLEVALDGGFAGVVMLLAASIWWLLASLRVWRGRGGDRYLARAGSAIVLLVMIASITDYPARTPMIMAVLVLAASWLAGITVSSEGATIRERARASDT